jgi:hypothetical protein
MASLAETINTALRAVGSTTENRLRDVIADFDSVNLSGEERLAAVATTVAALASTHHRRHRNVYLDAVKVWSLEISSELRPEPLRLRTIADKAIVVEAADQLIGGVESLIELMNGDAIRTQDRLVTELAVVTRLLGEHEPGVIHLALLCVTRALDRADYQPGDAVMVPLHETFRVLTRESDLEASDLEALAPRGCA